MECELASKLESANLQRTQYLLKAYPEYLASMPPEIDVKISKSVMSILAYSLRDRTVFSSAEFEIMDACGPFLPRAIQNAADVIRGFPEDISSKIYPVLYHRYLSDEGTSISLEQLALRLGKDELIFQPEEIQALLSDGERIMASLLFDNRLISAMHIINNTFCMPSSMPTFQANALYNAPNTLQPQSQSRTLPNGLLPS